MCVVSMIGDHQQDKWREPYVYPSTSEPVVNWRFESGVSREDFEALKKEVEELKKLLIKAKIYDEENGEPACEMEDKVALIKRIAEAVGVDLEDVFGK